MTKYVVSNKVAYKAVKWKVSLICLVAGMIELVSIELSMLVTLSITLDWFISVVVMPYSKTGISNSYWISLLPILFLSACLIPISCYLYEPDMVLNTACMAIGSSIPTMFSSIYFLLYNISFATLCTLYYILIKMVMKSARISKTGIGRIKPVVYRVLCIILTSFTTCLVINSLSVMSFSKYSLESAHEIVIGITLLPLPAIVNPLNYRLVHRKSWQGISLKLNRRT